MQTFCEVSSTQTRSTVKHICEAEHDVGQSQCKGLAKQSYSRLTTCNYCNAYSCTCNRNSKAC